MNWLLFIFGFFLFCSIFIWSGQRWYLSLFGFLFSSSLFYLCSRCVALHIWLSLHLWSVPMHAPRSGGLITVNASHEKKISFFSTSLSLSDSLYHAYTRHVHNTYIFNHFSFHFPYLRLAQVNVIHASKNVIYGGSATKDKGSAYPLLLLFFATS